MVGKKIFLLIIGIISTSLSAHEKKNVPQLGCVEAMTFEELAVFLRIPPVVQSPMGAKGPEPLQKSVPQDQKKRSKRKSEEVGGSVQEEPAEKSSFNDDPFALGNYPALQQFMQSQWSLAVERGKNAEVSKK